MVSTEYLRRQIKAYIAPIVEQRYPKLVQNGMFFVSSENE